MGAKHYKYIAKNNTLEIKENFFLGGGLRCCVNCIHTQFWTWNENITYCIFIHLFNTILLNTYMPSKMFVQSLVEEMNLNDSYTTIQ